MPGQHADGVGPRRGDALVIGVLVFLVVGVLALVGIGLFFTGDQSNSPEAASQDPLAERCAGERFQVQVAAAPEIFGPLEEIAERVTNSEQTVDGRCLDIDVAPVQPSEVFATLSEGGSTDARLWVPDSGDWLRRAELADTRVLSPSLAMSPLVLATTEAGAESLDEHAGTWEELAFASEMAVSDPELSGVATSALVAIGRSIPREGDDPAAQVRERFGKSVLALLGNKVDDVSGELDSVAGGSGLARPVPASEQQVLRLAADRPNADLAPVYPRGGTVALDYPLVALSGTDQRIDQVGSILERYASDGTGRNLLRDAGFRAPDGSDPPPDAPSDVELLDGAADDAREAIRTWATMNIDTNMLAVIDLSGSMASDAGDGRTRIELARDAAQAALAYFPDSSRIGVWGFSVRRDGNQDYETLVPTRTLRAAQRQTLAAATATMVERTGGGTGLYDTVLAAYRDAQAHYGAGRINSIVLLTDGRNEDDPGGIGKAELLAELKRLADPERPIAVVFVGMGPEADVGTLTEIAGAVGGQAYQASSPEDMERIIITAFLQRPCTTPACS